MKNQKRSCKSPEDYIFKISNHLVTKDDLKAKILGSQKERLSQDFELLKRKIDVQNQIAENQSRVHTEPNEVLSSRNKTATKLELESLKTFTTAVTKPFDMTMSGADVNVNSNK